ncbi:MAG TPA: hypothetical protein PLL26_04710 [Candidatus Dojkabacteria bacterium]|nr:hypothetical protein [Candidatus Dojkabacteria bacterium]
MLSILIECRQDLNSILPTFNIYDLEEEMASVLTIIVKGNSKSELDKNFSIVDSYMNRQNFLILVSSINPNFNPRIYYSNETLETKKIHDIITVLKTDKTINHAIRLIEYASHLNKV